MNQRIRKSFAWMLSLILVVMPVCNSAFGTSRARPDIAPKDPGLLRPPVYTKPGLRARPQTLPRPRGQATVTLADGSTLATGGEGPTGPLAGAVLAGAAPEETQLPQGLHDARAWHTSTVLPDGRVFIFGGAGANGHALGSAELFDPATKSFEYLPAAGLTARAYHTATLLTDGLVLIAGGVSRGGHAVGKAELWDFKARAATGGAAPLNVARQKHRARLLADGRVLIEVGVDEYGNETAAAEAFDPTTKEFAYSGPPVEPDEQSAPYLAASLPANDAADVPVDTRIALRFSKPLRVQTADAGTFVLSGPDGAVYAKVVAAENGRLVFLTPSELLKPGVTYTVSITGPTDGANAAVPTAVSFTTQGKPDEAERRPGGEPDWVPDATNLRDDWRSREGQSPWQQLPALAAEQGVTALAGQALTLRGLPLVNATLELDGQTTTTDHTGRFLLRVAAATGHRVLKIDGRTAARPGGTYGIFRIGVDITQGRTNVLGYTIWMPRLDMANAVTLSSPTAVDVSVTNPRIPGLELRLPAQTVVRDLDGQAVTQISITPIPTDRPPFPLPPGVDVPVFFTIQPGGARLIPPRAQLIYPNFTNSRPGARIDFWNYDAEGKGWYVYGQGTVSASGAQIIPDPGVVLYEFSGAMVALPSIAPQDAPSPCNPESGCGDPVDTATGLFVYSKTDLVLPDTMSIALTRTYRPRDAQMRPFGIGATHPYEMFLVGTTWPYSYIDLILADGGRVHYDRVSAGTSYSDAVYEHTGSPSAFYKSRIRWIGRWQLTLKDGSIYEFPDAEGSSIPRYAALTAARDRYGNALTLTRDTNRNLTKITSPNGRFIDFTYDAFNRITKAKDNIGREVIYAYDASGRLAQVTDAGGGITKYTYDGSNRMLTVEDARGIVYLTNVYDASGRVLKQTMADDTPGDPNDNPTYQFAYTTNINGKITQTDVTDPRGNVARLQYNGSGYVTSRTYALGRPEQQAVTFERQAGTNLIQSVTDPLGRRTSYTYDTWGDLLSTTLLAGTTEALTLRYTYEPLYHLPASMTDPLGRVTSLEYDSRGNCVGLIDPLGRRGAATYNAAGQALTTTDSLGHTTRFSYEAGDLASMTDPLGRRATLFTDGAGRLRSVTDPSGQSVRFNYDALNQVVKLTDPQGKATEFTYDRNGNLLTLKDASNHTTSYTYDNMDRLATRTDPLQGATSVERYEYDKAGNLTKFTDRRGKIAVYDYDGLDRPTFTGYGYTGSAYESTLSYTYDGGDRLRQVVDSASGTITLDYNGLNLVTSQATPLGTVSYTYDSIGRRSTMTVQGQPQVVYTYDNADRPTQISQGSASVSFTYDAADRRVTTTLPNNVVVEYDYDAASQLTGITYKRGATVLGDLTYEYDQVGRRTKMGGTYARAGLPQPLTSATYNANNQLTQRGAAALSYDANGNLISDGVNTYTWDARNQLAAISGAGLAASFQYDAFGRRVGKTVNGVSTGYFYDGANAVQELAGTTPAANLLAGDVDEVFTRTDTLGARHLLADGLGSTLGLTDGAGALVTQYTYEPFGQTAASGEASGNASKYTGREDDGTGLYYYRARYYSPALQRFVSEDPVGFQGGDSNLYAYVGNAPVNFTDPSGFERLHPAAGTWPPRPMPAAPSTAGRKDSNPGASPLLIAGAIAIADGPEPGPADAVAVVYLGVVAVIAIIAIATHPPVTQPAQPYMPPYMEARKSDKERATDVPSWVKGKTPKPGQSGKDFAKDVCDEKYGPGNYDTGPGSEFNKIKKWIDRK